MPQQSKLNFVENSALLDWGCGSPQLPRPNAAITQHESGSFYRRWCVDISYDRIESVSLRRIKGRHRVRGR
jgi:hypothetical protein